MSQELLGKFKKIRSMARHTKPDAAWVSSTRSTLLMQARNSMPRTAVEKKSAIKEWIKFFAPIFAVNKWVRTPVFAVMVVVVAIFGGSLLSVSAAEKALPGDLLYSVKLATEQARIALAKNPQDKVKLKTEFTERRVDEMKQVVASPTTNRADKVIQTAETLKRDLHTIKQQLGDLQSQTSPETVKETAKIVDEKTNAVVQALQQSKDAMTPEEKIKVTEAQVAASDTSVKAIEVLVDAHKSAGDVVTEQDVVDVVKSHNESVARTMAEAVGLNPDFVTSTVSMPLPVTTKAMTSSTATAIEQVTQAQKSLTEADQLVAEQKMDEAVEKLKIGTQQAFAAQKTFELSNLNASTSTTAAVSSTSTTPTTTPAASTSTTTKPETNSTTTTTTKPAP
ncbi:MAG: DUF5667 domain-containing protein [Patescibacteria group bacterium]|nr:DUF5667 domain-containing protein [Patescibacteria group bacterium]